MSGVRGRRPLTAADLPPGDEAATGPAPEGGFTLRGQRPLTAADLPADFAADQQRLVDDGMDFNLRGSRPLTAADIAAAAAARTGPAAPVLRSRGAIARTLFNRSFPVVAIVVMVTQLGIAWINYRDQLNAHTERAELLVNLAARAVARPVWNIDEQVYKPQLESLALDANFRGVELLDENGNPLLRLGDVNARGRGVISVSADLTLPESPRAIGRLTLLQSTEELRDSAIRQVAIAIGAFLALIIAFFITLYLAVRSHVVQPLRRLLMAMGEVERKRWTHVEVARDDEIGSVSTAFNAMVEGLRSGDEAKQLLAELEAAHDRLERANKLVLESINYARRIQTSMLPDQRALVDSVADIGMLWRPLHTVGGDYFWIERIDGLSFVVVVDCTGHGVPGAFITLVVAAALDRVLHERGLRSPAAMLVALDGMVRARLRQDGRGADSDDGLDCAICVWDEARQVLTFAGAGLPLLINRGGPGSSPGEGGIETMRGGRHGLGYRTLVPQPDSFTDVEIPVAPGMGFYLATDGVSDQMGGTPRRLLGRKRLAELLQGGTALPMPEQMARLEAALAAYRGAELPRDDMTMIGFVPVAAEAVG